MFTAHRESAQLNCHCVNDDGTQAQRAECTRGGEGWWESEGVAAAGSGSLWLRAFGQIAWLPEPQRLHLLNRNNHIIYHMSQQAWED